MTTAPTILTRAARLRVAQHLGYLVSLTSETSLRDRHGRQCGDAGQLIAHLIVSPATGRVSIRVDGCALGGRELCPAGWSLVWCLVTEHGANASWRYTKTIVDIHSIDALAAPIVVRRLIDPDLWIAPCEVQ